MLQWQDEWTSSFVSTSLTTIFSENSVHRTENPSSDDLPLTDFLTSDIAPDTSMELLAEIANNCALAEREVLERKKWRVRGKWEKKWQSQGERLVSGENRWRVRSEAQRPDTQSPENVWPEDNLDDAPPVIIATHNQCEVGLPTLAMRFANYEKDRKARDSSKRRKENVGGTRGEIAKPAKRKAPAARNRPIAPNSHGTSCHLRVSQNTPDASKSSSIQSRSKPRRLQQTKRMHTSSQIGRKIMRSRSGCWTCRIRHKSCPEDGVVCSTCLRLLLVCDTSPKRPDYMKNEKLAAKKLADIQAVCRPAKFARNGSH